MGRLEKTIESKKNRKSKMYSFLIILILIVFFVTSISLIDYRTGNFMGNYDKPLFIKLYGFFKGLSLK